MQEICVLKVYIMVQSISAINGNNNINFNGLKQLKPTKNVATEKYTQIKGMVNNSEGYSQIKEKVVSVAKNTAKEIKKNAGKTKAKLKELFTEKEDLRTPEEIQKARDEEEKAEFFALLAMLGLTAIAAFSYFVLPWFVLFFKIRSFIK